MGKFLKSNLSLNSPNAFSLQNLPDAFATFFQNEIIPLLQLQYYICSN